MLCNTQYNLGNPSHKEFMKMVISKYGVKYIIVNPYDITNALAIYGPDLIGVRGKQVRNQSLRVETGTEDILNEFHWLHHFYTLTDLSLLNTYQLERPSSWLILKLRSLIFILGEYF